jgi:subfamily B ATP-binding cassette protein MsbA
MAKSSIKSLWRLFWTFGKPYRGHMAVGLLTGVLLGGAVFGVLRSVAALLSPFDQVAQAGAAAAAGPTASGPGTPAAGSAEVQAVRRTDAPQAPQPAPAPSSAGTGGGAAPGEGAAEPDREPAARGLDRYVERYLPWAERLGLGHVEHDQALTWRLMLAAVLGVLLFLALRTLAIVANHYCLRWLGARIVVDLRVALLQALHRQSLSFFGRQDVGQLISRCTYDTARIEGGIASSIVDVSGAPFVIAAAVVSAVLDAYRQHLGKTMLFFAIVAPLLIGPLLVMGRWVKRFSRRALRRVALLVSRFEENLTCIRVVKAYNTEAVEQQRFRDESESYFRMVVKAILAEVFMGPSLELAAAVTVCLFLVVCYLQKVPISGIVAMAFAGYLIYKPIKQLVKVNAIIQRTAAAAERVLELLDTDTSLPVPANPVVIPAFRDRVVFEHVDFRYEADGNQVLQDICLDVPRGSVIAFVGETGSGKTTIVNLLARFYDPTVGRILVDGHDLQTLDVASLRRLIGFVTQETLLFNDTVAHNIAYGTPEATPARIEDAARKANAHEFIAAEAEGYERVVGDKGMLLSGGQRQRIAIARAILKNPPILILDEATSALDTVTEQLVQEAINRVMADRTVFAIAHRLSTVRHADVICLLDKGRIVERGTHDELYARGGRYRRLCDLQFH